MDIGASFTYPTEDENWLVKILIGAVIGFIPIVGYLLQMGFAVEAIKRTQDGVPTPLPEWDDWGAKLVKGLVYWVITFVYALPLILIGGCIGAVSAVATSAISGDSDTATFISTLLVTCFGCLSLIYVIGMGLVLPAAVARYADTGQFGTAFQFGEVFSMVRNNVSTYAIVLVMTIVAGLVGLLGLIGCGIGIFLTLFYAQLIIAHLYGSAYNVATQGTQAVGEPVM